MWNATEARKELKKMNLEPLKRVDITDKYLRYRITRNFKGMKYFTKELSPTKGIVGVFQVKK